MEAHEDDEPKIYLLPNLMTAGNLLCGFLAILTIFKGMQAVDLVAAKPFYEKAMLYIFGACLFDLLDGRLARLGGQESPFGQEFDSLADMISFGIAPAMLVSRAVLSDLSWPTKLDPAGDGVAWAVAFIYLLCGGIRLARFNCLARTGSGGPDFRGIPIPMAAGFVASLTYLIISIAEKKEGLLTLGPWSYVLALMILGVSFLMVSNIVYPSFKKIDLKTKANVWTLLGGALVLAVLIRFRLYAPSLVFIGYLFIPVFRRKVKKEDIKASSL